jgi:light-regulated signal transduction histidine kinase (bacteriophytochrome)
MIPDSQQEQQPSQQQPSMTFPEYRAHVGAVTGELLDVMSRVARGDFSTYCTVTSDDDLGALALGVNLMVSELRENAGLRRVASLEEKLQDKAAALSHMVISLTAANEELKRYRDKVDEYNRTLEERVRVRTDELQRSNQELNDFTYIVSHDLKEPLRAIEAFSRFLADEYGQQLDEKGRNYVQRIRVNTKRLQEFIDDLLELSRIARIRNPYETVDLRLVVEKARDALSYAVAEKGATLACVGSFPRIHCDRTRIYQVFLNLIENALKFSDKPAPAVEVSYEDGGEDHVFRVKDNGIGIEAQYFKQIFQVFERLHPREAYPGSGAGLTISKKIVEQHGGTIWVESRPGEGSTFSFALPKKATQPAGVEG